MVFPLVSNIVCVGFADLATRSFPGPGRGGQAVPADGAAVVAGCAADGKSKCAYPIEPIFTRSSLLRLHDLLWLVTQFASCYVSSRGHFFLYVSGLH